VERDSQAQDEVIDIYNERIAESEALRSNWVYMTSKQLCDFALLCDADLNGAEVLNIGCFLPLDELAFVHVAAHWTATDLGEETIKHAERVAQENLEPSLMERLSFQVADGTRLPFESDSFDVAMSMSTIDHVVDRDDRSRFVIEMARVTRPGGRVIVTVPNRWSRGYANREKLYGVQSEFFEYCFSPTELRRMVRAAGLDVVRFTSTSEIPELSPRAVLPSLGQRRPLLRAYNHIARYFGSRMGILARKPG
jgi:SAM-dependent methyltransferase